jgi:hypothetical protein
MTFYFRAKNIRRKIDLNEFKRLHSYLGVGLELSSGDEGSGVAELDPSELGFGLLSDNPNPPLFLPYAK